MQCSPPHVAFRVLCQNDQFTQHFGHARSPAEYQKYVSALSHDACVARQDYIADLLRVGTFTRDSTSSVAVVKLQLAQCSAWTVQGSTLHKLQLDVQLLAPMFDRVDERLASCVAKMDSKACPCLSELPLLKQLCSCKYNSCSVAPLRDLLCSHR